MHLMLAASDFSKARRRLVQMHYESGVGHLGGNLSALDAMLVVFHEALREGDEFILSKGHSAGALYVALWSLGRLSDEELRTFHRDDTRLPGHPPVGSFPEIAFATGSLGHGLSLAAGTALANRLTASASRTVCLTSDGEWQEGSTWEALVFACHHRLDRLCVLIDHNELQGFGSTDQVASMSPLWERLSGFRAEVRVVDGHEPQAIRDALEPCAGRPLIVVLKTVKGRGVKSMENRMDSHYLPLSADQYELALAEIGHA